MKRLLAGCFLAALTVSVALVGTSGAASAAPECPWAAPPAPDPYVHVKRVGSMTISDIGLRTPIFQGWLPDIESEASRALNKGPAFYPQNMRLPNGLVNGLPGQGGTVAMLGHRTTRTHPFCLLANLKIGSLAIIKMRYGKGSRPTAEFIYREVGQRSLPGNDWSAFEWPARFDPQPKKWNKGIRREYLVVGACDPPHSAARRLNAVFKLIAEYELPTS